MLVFSLLLFLLFFVTHSSRNFTVIGLSGFSINLSFPAPQLSWGFSLWGQWQCPPVTCTGTQAQYLDPAEARAVMSKDHEKPSHSCPILAAPWDSDFPLKNSQRNLWYITLKERNLSALYNKKPITVGKRQKLYWINEAGGGERVIHRQIKQTNHVTTLFCCVLLGVSGFILALKEKGHLT